MASPQNRIVARLVTDACSTRINSLAARILAAEFDQLRLCRVFVLAGWDWFAPFAEGPGAKLDVDESHRLVQVTGTLGGVPVVGGTVPTGQATRADGRDRHGVHPGSVRGAGNVE